MKLRTGRQGGRVEASPAKDWLPFAVVDVETTGFSPRLHDRIVEIAIVQLAAEGTTEDEYSTLVNPLRDVGATHVHGITATDLVAAPTFTEITGDVLERLRGRVLVSHNVRFDRDFLAAEFSAEGVFLPALPSLCTLQFAYLLHPALASHRLAACCEAAGFHQAGAHSALDDARATAQLLVAYMEEARAAGLNSLAAWGCSLSEFPLALWPSLPSSGRILQRSHGEVPSVSGLPVLARMVAGLTSVGSVGPRLAPYVDLLDRALEDRIVTEVEAEALQATAIEWGLSREEVLGAHVGYLEALVKSALADNVISELERRDLEAVTRLLVLDPGVLHAMLEQQRSLPTAPRDGAAMPSDSLAGLTVCFTGSLTGQIDGRPITRELAQELAIAAGLEVRERVTKDLDLLVVADPNTMSGKARNARKLGVRIMAELAFWRAIGIQDR